MKIEWNKVTWYSKLAAVVVFLATFLIAFNLGILWEQAHIEGALSDAPSSLNANTTTQTSSSSSTTKVTTPSFAGGGVGAVCGAFIKNAPTCASGLHCKLGVIADKGGVCVSN